MSRRGRERASDFDHVPRQARSVTSVYPGCVPAGSNWFDENVQRLQHRELVPGDTYTAVAEEEIILVELRAHLADEQNGVR